MLVFTVEYVSRIYTAPVSGKYLYVVFERENLKKIPLKFYECHSIAITTHSRLYEHYLYNSHISSNVTKS